LAQEIATTLTSAKKPAIISGCSAQSEDVLMAAANIAEALRRNGKSTGIALVLSECNSMGLTLLGGQPLKDAFVAIKKNAKTTAIILENDVYRHLNEIEAQELITLCQRTITIEHTPHRTTSASTAILPAGTFAEADGTLINNECRAQRFFQVYEPADEVRESWRWLIRIAAEIGDREISQWSCLDDITRAISREIPSLKGIEHVAPPAGFRINGQKIPRESHRFSGRTSILANINVSEPKPAQDIDSPLSYTMEGFRGQPPSSAIPFFWSPGWNSVQATNKYQEEVGGALLGGDPGIVVVSHNGQEKVEYYKYSQPEREAEREVFYVVPLHHIFGSEMLSARGSAVNQRVPEPYVAMNASDAALMQIVAGSFVSVDFDHKHLELPVHINSGLSTGVIGIPWGLPQLPFFVLPATATVKQITESLTARS
jgi:NADH-quinone oxidoreductase subunit G